MKGDLADARHVQRVHVRPWRDVDGNMATAPNPPTAYKEELQGTPWAKMRRRRAKPVKHPRAARTVDRERTLAEAAQKRIVPIEDRATLVEEHASKVEDLLRRGETHRRHDVPRSSRNESGEDAGRLDDAKAHMKAVPQAISKRRDLPATRLPNHTQGRLLLNPQARSAPTCLFPSD